MLDLQTALANLSTEQMKHIDSVLTDANIAYSAGNGRRVSAIFKQAKTDSRGKLKKIFAAFQKAGPTAAKRALDLHFEHSKTL